VESALCGSLESDGRFCFVAFSRNLSSINVKKFFSTYHVLKRHLFHKFCTLLLLAKIMTLQIALLFNINVSFPSNLMDIS
jgi:hypothetical protein